MEKKEYRVSFHEHPGKAMFHVKELLQANESIDITAGSRLSEVAIRVATTLERLGYITITNIQTLTLVEEGKRNIKLIISVKKTADFDKLFKEHEEQRKLREEQRQKETPKETAK